MARSTASMKEGEQFARPIHDLLIDLMMEWGVDVTPVFEITPSKSIFEVGWVASVPGRGMERRVIARALGQWPGPSYTSLPGLLWAQLNHLSRMLEDNSNDEAKRSAERWKTRGGGW